MKAAQFRRLSAALAAAALALLAACATAGGGVPAGRIAFRCEDGNSFHVEHVGRLLLLTTRAGSHWLRPSPSTVGAKFVSGEVAFIQDGDFAALNGAQGGPFRRCHESG